MAAYQADVSERQRVRGAATRGGSEGHAGGRTGRRRRGTAPCSFRLTRPVCIRGPGNLTRETGGHDDTMRESQMRERERDLRACVAFEGYVPHNPLTTRTPWGLPAVVRPSRMADSATWSSGSTLRRRRASTPHTRPHPTRCTCPPPPPPPLQSRSSPLRTTSRTSRPNGP